MQRTFPHAPFERYADHYLYTASLPTYMKAVQYRDCREANATQLKTAADERARALVGAAS